MQQLGSMTPCIEWEKSRTTAGYGRVFKDGKHVYAHRLAYCEANNLALEDISGLVVRHKCDNPPCVNPEHLEVGTHADNIRDRDARGRHRTAPPRGEESGSAKLTEDSVRKIRLAISSGEMQKDVAARFNVSRETIRRVVSGKSWGHLE